MKSSEGAATLKKIVALALALATPASPAAAASISVVFTGDDAIGRRVAYELREAISGSSQHKLVYSEKDAGFVIILVTVENTKDVSTSYAAVLTMPQFSTQGYRYYITTLVGNCGSSRVAECGRNILSGFDSSINEIAAALTEVLKK